MDTRLKDGNNKAQQMQNNGKVCHKFPPMIAQRQTLDGGVSTTVSPLLCFVEKCTYWCEIDKCCIDVCNHSMEHDVLQDEDEEDGGCGVEEQFPS